MKIKAMELTQYMEYFPEGFTLDDVIARIKTLNNVKTWTAIIHDKDVLPDGIPKRPHVHAVVTFSNATTSEAVAKKLGVPEQQIEKIRTTVKAARQYHVHMNDPSKYQYDPKEVKASFDYVEWLDDNPKKLARENIAKAIASGEIKEYNIFDKVDVDFYAKNKRYIQTCFEWRQGKLKSEDREMEVLYLHGLGGTGKTTFAKMFAKQRGYTAYVSSGGRHPLDDYKGEECIILDDVRADDFKLSEFLKLTDNNTDSLVGCRYYNKSIRECRLIIVTCCKSLEELFEDMRSDPLVNEDINQMRRRVTSLIELNYERAYVFEYDEKLKSHKLVDSFNNPVACLFNKQKRRELTNSVLHFLGKDLTPIEAAELDDFLVEKIGEELK